MIDRACVSLSDRCNLKCRYCHFADKQENTIKLNVQQADIILDNIHIYCKRNNIGRFKLGIVGAGEPFMESHILFHMLEYIVMNNYHEIDSYCVTNGTLLSSDIIQRLYEYRDILKLCISLDGYKELHNYGRAAYEAVMKSVHLYNDIFAQTPSINTTVNKYSYENKERLIEFFKNNGLFDVTFSKLFAYKSSDLYISTTEYMEFLEYAESAGIRSRQFRKEITYDCIQYGKLCGVGKTNVFITSEGVYPCGRFYKNQDYKLGEPEDTLFDIEKSFSYLSAIVDGKCYYETYVE